MSISFYKTDSKMIVLRSKYKKRRTVEKVAFNPILQRLGRTRPL